MRLNKNDFGNFDISKLNLGGLKSGDLKIELPKMPQPFYETDHFKKMMKEEEEKLARVQQEMEQYRQNVLNTLIKIEGNTANLTTIINLIQTNNEKQGEIFEIVSNLLALAKEEDQLIVESKYRKIMNKITTFTDDAETITTLIGFGTMIFQILKAGA